MATLSTISYSQKAGDILSKINANVKAIESGATGLSNSTLVGTPSTYSDLVSKVNISLDSCRKISTGRAKTHTDIAASAGALIDGVNTNLTTINGQADDFLADDCPMFFEINQLLDLQGTAARVFCQQDDYKFGCNKLLNTLLFSDDCGVTWGYTKSFANCVNIRMAHVFKNGNIIFSTKVDNKVYFSTDNLDTLIEITVYDTDGETPLAFHVPVDEDFPGIYFGATLPESYVVDGVEMLVYGNYWQGSVDNTGTVPVNIYDVRDDGSFKCIYKFGDNTYRRDDGTNQGGETAGTGIVGDPTNPVVCYHFHHTAYDAVNKKWYFQIGDTPSQGEIWLIEATYNSETDTWSFTEHPMYDTNIGAESAFRMYGSRFTPDGNVLWISDGSFYGGIFKCSVANYKIPDLTRHTQLFRTTTEPSPSRGDCISLSEYGQHMMAAKYLNDPTVLCSNDYGNTWGEMPDNYILEQVEENNLSSSRRFLTKDSNGFYLFVWFSLLSQSTAFSALVKPHTKPGR